MFLYYKVVISIYWIQSIHILGFKISHGESLESYYQSDDKKIYDVITVVSFANTINSMKLISISKPHQTPELKTSSK